MKSQVEELRAQIARVRQEQAAQGELLAKWDCARCYNLRFSPDSRFLAAIAPDGTTRVWSMSLNRFLRLLASGTRTEPPSQGLTANQIVTVDYFGQLRVWDGDSGQLVGGRKLPEHDVRAHTPDWLRIVTVDETQSGLRYWDLLKDTNRSLPSQDTILTRAAFTPDGRRLLTADHKEGVRIWDTESAEFQDNHAPDPKPKLEVPAETKAWSAAFSPDGSHFVLAQTDGNIAVYSLISNKRVCTSKGGHGARVKKSESDSAGTTWDVAFSPNGKQVATVSEDNTARLWNVQNCVAQREFLGHTDRAMRVGFSPDNARVITTGQDGSVRIWDAESGGLLGTLRYQDEKHSRAFISQDGRRMVTLPSPLLTPTFDSEERPRAEAHLWDLSTEQRKPEQLAKLLECYSPLKFESDTSAVIVPNEPAPKKCASFRWTLRPR